MRFMGSKNRFKKELIPIIQKYINDNHIKKYLEPFVGGANVIDKIKCENKYGSDNHKYLIALLKQAQKDTTVFPLDLTESEYKCVKNNMDNYEDWYVGLVGFCGSFGSKWFSGYARSHKENRNCFSESVKNIIKQSPNLQDIIFNHIDFRDINTNIKDFCIYCDPPYKNTVKYSKDEFPYEEFYDWCRNMSRNNIILISEYTMPNDFKCLWEKETKVSIDRTRNFKNERTEKLFTINK